MKTTVTQSIKALDTPINTTTNNNYWKWKIPLETSFSSQTIGFSVLTLFAHLWMEGTFGRGFSRKVVRINMKS